MTIPFSLKTAFFAAALTGCACLPLAAQSPAPQASPSLSPAPSSPLSGRPDHAPPFRFPPHPLMNALDTNHDGILSADEIANAPASLKKLDKNGDGQLTEDELRPPPPPGGRGGPPRGQPAPRSPDGDSPQVRNQSNLRVPPPPGQAPLAGQDRTSAEESQRAPSADRTQRPPPRLEDDPVARRLDTGGQTAAPQTPPPASAPATLFDLLDANHDGTLSEEELRNAPAVLKQLDLKSIVLPRSAPGNREDFRPPGPPPQ